MRAKFERMFAGLRKRECCCSGLRVQSKQLKSLRESVSLLLLFLLRAKAFILTKITACLFILGTAYVRLSSASGQFGDRVQLGVDAITSSPQALFWYKLWAPLKSWCVLEKECHVEEVLGEVSLHATLQRMSTITVVVAIATEGREPLLFKPVISWRPTVPLMERPCFQRSAQSFLPLAARGTMLVLTHTSRFFLQRLLRRTKRERNQSQQRYFQRAVERNAQSCSRHLQKEIQRRSFNSPLPDFKSRRSRPQRRTLWQCGQASQKANAGA